MSRPGLIPVAVLSVASTLGALTATGASLLRGGAAPPPVTRPVTRALAGIEFAPEPQPTGQRAGQTAPPSVRASSPPAAAPAQLPAAVRSWPRLKPDPDRAPAVPKATPAGRGLAPDEPVGITDPRDAPGGPARAAERPLRHFGDYEATITRARDEAGYEALVLPKGGGLVRMLRRAGFDAAEAEQAVLALSERADLTALRAGDAVEVAGPAALVTMYEVAGGAAPRRLDRVRIRPAPGVRVTAWRGPAGWKARRDAAAIQTRYATAATVITDSLFAAGARAEVPPEVLVRTANLFLYDVDFARDVRRGDRFEVVYETFTDEEGTPRGTGEIVFAAMTWRGGQRAKAYYRYEGGERPAYFDAAGRSARRLLMRTPIEGARVTSRFGPRRHPTLGYRRDHKGVDFGARSGTPILAAGDGVVLRANRFGSFGNYLRIRHANGYETAYAHLSGFARDVRKGTRVSQGEVVAYVGSTGRSTGPHLHYEVHRNGEAVNPMTLAMEGGEALEGEALAAFGEDDAVFDALRAWPHAVAVAGAPAPAAATNASAAGD